MAAAQKYKAIVIGVSAGGLYALSDILMDLPRNYPIPIIIVQHRIKEQGHLLEEVLQTKCWLKIKQADEKEKIMAGHVYVAPPDYHLLIEKDHTFSLTTDVPVKYSRPSIDVLFESAATVYRSSLIGIILTGANSDGSNGISQIKKYGGLTVAQDPMEAQFSFMPEAAIETGDIQYIWRLSHIREFLADITKV